MNEGMKKESAQWMDVLGVHTVHDFNEAIALGRSTEIIQVSEALQEKQLAAIADEIVAREARLILIAGPSSSGKTTTSKRLSILLAACGKRAHTLSTDDYFVNREDTPRDAEGVYDYECIEAEDTTLFNRQMNELLSGGMVELPRYDFPTGKKVYEGKMLHLSPGDVIILEGNHALNPIFSAQVPDEQKYRIYVSPLTPIRLDENQEVSTSDIRLLRRILRDYSFRGYSAAETIARRERVDAGERKWIFPFHSLADVHFDSVLLYEMAVLKDRLLPILAEVAADAPEFDEARRLMQILQHYQSIPDKQVPATSLLREFAGGSIFVY